MGTDIGSGQLCENFSVSLVNNMYMCVIETARELTATLESVYRREGDVKTLRSPIWRLCQNILSQNDDEKLSMLKNSGMKKNKCIRQ